MDKTRARFRTVIEQQGIIGAIIGLAGIIFGGLQTKRKQQIEQLLAEQKAESEAIKSANVMIVTLTEAYKLQHEEITDLKFRLKEIDSELQQYRDDRHMFMRIIQENNTITIRDEDKQRLGINE
jgi:uncharacterized protein HemX